MISTSTLMHTIYINNTVVNNNTLYAYKYERYVYTLLCKLPCKF